MGKIRAPFPEHEIMHIRAGAINEGGHQYTGRGFAQPGRDPPRSRLAPARAVEHPRARHVRKFDIGGLATLVSSEVDDVIDINVVADNRQRIQSKPKAVRHLDDDAFGRGGQIERGNTSRIESAAGAAGPLSRQRGEGPPWIMAAIEGRLKPHTKPPSATPSR